MNKVIAVIIVLLLVGYSIHSCVENKAAREEQRIESEQEEDAIKDSIQALVSRFNAVTDWDDQLSNGKSYRIEPILTVELEELWLAGKPILFIGKIQDINTNDEETYTVLIERNLLSSLGNMYSTDLQLSLTAPKDKIDTFLKSHPDLFKGLNLDKDIAVVANIVSIDTIYVSGEEGAREEIKVGHGKMLDLEFVGQVRL